MADNVANNATDTGTISGSFNNQNGDHNSNPILQPMSTPPVFHQNPPRRFTARLFGLNRSSERRNTVNRATRFASLHDQTLAHGTATEDNDLWHIYKEDAYGEETFPEARVWRIYNKESQIYDAERIEAWRDALDVLLVFIGLFSAIVTTFVVQTSQSLQPDYAQMTAVLTFEILRTLRNTTVPISDSNFPSSGPDPRLGQATPSGSDKIVNALWFTSLAISLSTALLTVLTKQWLYHYTTSVSGTSRERARIRQFRYSGMETYHVPLIIDLLPLLLNVALVLFLVGLTIFLSFLDAVTAGIVGAVMCIAYVLYLVSVYLSIRDPQCPYKSPLSFYAFQLHHLLFQLLNHAHYWTISTLAKFCFFAASAVPRSSEGKRKTVSSEALEPKTRTDRDTLSLPAAEKLMVETTGTQLDVDAMVCLYQTSASSAVRSVALEAFGGLSPSDVDTRAAHQVLDSTLYAMIGQCSRASDIKNPLPGLEQRHDRLLRSLCAGNRPQRTWELGDEMWPISENHQTPQRIFSRWLLPWYDAQHQAGYKFAPIFAICATRTFPLSVWATVLQLAIRYHPGHPLIRVVLLSTIHLPVDPSERGAGKIDVAIQNPYIRRLALQYLGIARSNQENTLILFLSAFHDLLSDDHRKELVETACDFCSLSLSAPGSYLPHLLSSLLPSLFRSLSSQTQSFDSPEEQRSLVVPILSRFFESPDVVDKISWETIYCVTEIWKHPFKLIHTFTTPTILHAVLKQFRRPGRGEESEEEWVKKTAANLGWILHHCVDPRHVNLAQVTFTLIRELDMLPLDIESAKETTCLRHFWSPGMHGKLISDTGRLKNSQRTQRWFQDWVTYLHVPERLVFICTGSIAATARDALALGSLCRLQPYNNTWPSCFAILLTLFNDQGFLQIMADENENVVREPHYHLSERLTKMKRILRDHHDLSDSRFDVPQFNRDGDPSSRSSLALIGTEDTSLPSRHSNSMKWPKNAGLLAATVPNSNSAQLSQFGMTLRPNAPEAARDPSVIVDQAHAHLTLNMESSE